MFTSIRFRFVLAFLFIGLFPLAIGTWLVKEYQHATLKENASNHLISIREMKRQQVESYLESVKGEIRFLSAHPLIKEAAIELRQGANSIKPWQVKPDMEENIARYYKEVFWPKLELPEETPLTPEQLLPKTDQAKYLQYHYITARGVAEDKSAFGKAYKVHHPLLTGFMDGFGYEDLLLVDAKTSQIIYSTQRQTDFGANLSLSPIFQNTVLVEAWQALKSTENPQEVQLFDFKPYLPSLLQPVAIVGAPVFVEDEKVALLFLKISISELDILTGNDNWASEGLGQTGECLLIGSDGKFRSDSRFFLENEDEFISSLKTKGIGEGLLSAMQENGTTIMTLSESEEVLRQSSEDFIAQDYRGKEALFSMVPLRMADVSWLMVAKVDTAEILAPLNEMEENLFKLTGMAGLVAIAMALILAFWLASPIHRLSKGTRQIAAGNYKVNLPEHRSDEMGQLMKAFNQMSGQIDAQVTEISEKNEELQQLLHQVHQQKEEIETQRDDLELQKNKLDKAYSNIQKSINYAQRIQSAKLPSFQKIKRGIPESFVLFKPRDVVSGDFYWYEEVNGLIFIAAADCTGHGVPGAFMSMIGSQLLSDLVLKHHLTSPDEILNALHEEVRKSLKTEETEVNDGMDMALCVIDKKRELVEYAGAKNPLLYARSGNLYQIKGDRSAIGGKQKEEKRIFTKHQVHLDEPTVFYLFSDGYQDQFGGEHNQKFMIKNLRELFREISGQPIEFQKLQLEETFENWKGEQHQLDDVLVVGFKVG